MQEHVLKPGNTANKMLKNKQKKLVYNLENNYSNNKPTTWREAHLESTVKPSQEAKNK